MVADEVIQLFCALTGRIAKGEPLFEQGAPANSAYILLRGRITLFIGINWKARRRLFHQCSGSVLGLSEALLGSHYQTTAIAATTATVHEISRADLLDMLKVPEDGMAVLSLLTDRLGQIYDLLKQGTFRRPHGPGVVTGGLDLKARSDKATIN